MSNIFYHDDEKEKHHSHQATFKEAKGIYENLSYFEDTGYGNSKESAKQELLALTLKNIKHLKAAITALEELVETNQ